MDSQTYRSFLLILLVISSICCFQARADGSGSVFFLDSSDHQYLRPRSSEPQSMSLPEVGAAISVLLGFAPPSTLSSAESEKLNEVLMPNPFDRPRAVFMLEINGVKDMKPMSGSYSDVLSRALKSNVALGQKNADILLSDEEDVSLVSLDEPLPDAEWTDKDLTDFASWLGGSYVSTEPLNGELTLPLANDVQLKLHMSKRADREFTTSIVSLIHNVQRAVQMHQDFSGSTHSPAELIRGRFDGVKALQEQYGTDIIVQQGVELLVASLSKIYDSLQTVYKGQIVGVVLFDESPATESEMILTVKYTSRSSSRLLQETKGFPPNSTMIAEVILVRRTLAVITAIILIIATLIGVYFLMYMPLTRDTLLYSNVKLD